MTPEQIDALMAAAGIDGVQVFYSAIEIDTHVRRPDEGYWDGYSVLQALIEAATRDEREACALVAERAGERWAEHLRRTETAAGVRVAVNSESEARSIADAIRARTTA